MISALAAMLILSIVLYCIISILTNLEEIEDKFTVELKQFINNQLSSNMEGDNDEYGIVQ